MGQEGEKIKTTKNIHALGTASNPSSLLHALKFSSARVLRLALHVIIVVVAASGADEEGSRQKRCRARANFLDLRDIVR